MEATETQRLIALAKVEGYIDALCKLGEVKDPCKVVTAGNVMMELLNIQTRIKEGDPLGEEEIDGIDDLALILDKFINRGEEEE